VEDRVGSRREVVARSPLRVRVKSRLADPESPSASELSAMVTDAVNSLRSSSGSMASRRIPG